MKNRIREISTALFLMASLILVIADVQAIEPIDSIHQAKELSEVVIVGQNQSAKAGELSFIPTKRQKETAMNGYDLLRHLAMPQITVGDVADNISTLSGERVVIFINGLPASDMEVNALKTKDVMQVLYFDYPSDPKYGNAHHVIDFRVKEMLGGGYTRLQTTASLLNNTSTSAFAFSRYLYKRMIYDVYLGWNYYNSHHSASSLFENYSLLTPEGESYQFEKTSILKKSRSRSWGLPINFRALYITSRFRASNSLYFSFSDHPISYVQGEQSFNPGADQSYIYTIKTPTNSRTMGWNGYYYYELGNGFAASLATSLNYSNRHDYKTHDTGLPNQIDIIANSKEDAWDVAVNAYLQKRISRLHAINVSFNVGYDDFDIMYSGSSYYNSNIKNTRLNGMLGYNGKFPFGMNIYGEAGASWLKSITNDKGVYKLSPYARVNMSYSPGRQHQINFTGQYSLIGLTEARKA